MLFEELPAEGVEEQEDHVARALGHSTVIGQRQPGWRFVQEQRPNEGWNIAKAIRLILRNDELPVEWLLARHDRGFSHFDWTFLRRKVQSRLSSR